MCPIADIAYDMDYASSTNESEYRRMINHIYNCTNTASRVQPCVDVLDSRAYP